jgi:hypothetical protein
MTEGKPEETRSSSALGIMIGVGALGLLLVVLMFRSSPSTDVPPDQGPIAKAVVDNLMTNGVLVDYACDKNTAWANRAVWTKYNFEQRRNMVIALATVCDAQRAGYRMSILDYDTKRELGSFDGKEIRME